MITFAEAIPGSPINVYFRDIFLTPTRMRKLLLVVLLVGSLSYTSAQQYSMSVGLYSGVILPYTIDTGIDKDPRYKEKFQLKYAPVGFSYGMDYEGFGFLIHPGFFSVGQSYYVVNTSGGHNGLREIDLNYVNVPVSFKVHIINLSFFKVSGVASFGGAFLVKGEERIRHTDTKLTFPPQVYPILPAEYVVEYDGVLVPNVEKYVISSEEEFKPFQIFVGGGLRSDWDVSNHWRVSFDFRLNYGLLDPREDKYINRLKANKTLYDLPGKRNDMFAQFSVGISRYIEFDKHDRERGRKLQGKSGKYSPQVPKKKPKPKNSLIPK